MKREINYTKFLKRPKLLIAVSELAKTTWIQVVITLRYKDDQKSKFFWFGN